MIADEVKNQMLGIYYLATLPARQKLADERRQSQSVPAMCLFYHRVADENPNAWTISNARFKSQVKWLRERFDIVPLKEAQRRVGTEQNCRPTVSITFDDGYADNCSSAVPWLIEERIPFCYFVTSRNLQTGEPFQHDKTNNVPLEPNTIDQLRKLPADLVEIGAHSRTHADLGQLDNEEELFEEIVGSKRDLESLLERPVRYFAFPFGLPENMSTAAFRVAFEAGFWGVCSAYGGYNVPGDDPFHIQRIHGDPQWNRFRNWLTIDPRKLNQKKKFWPGDYRNRF